MCTVTYVPQTEGCIISSNRDEAVIRSAALLPAVYQLNEQRLLFPKDPVGGGTWIVSGQKATVCLFNGAFEPHLRKASYRISRGIIPLEFFNYEDVFAFSKSFDFIGIEPFSMVVYQDKVLSELKWDEKEIHLIEHDIAKPHIWASATLYPQSVRQERELWFEEWFATVNELSQQSVLEFHSTKRGDDHNGLIIDRKEGLKTVSVSSIAYHPENGARMTYLDLGKRVRTEHRLEF